MSQVINPTSAIAAPAESSTDVFRPTPSRRNRTTRGPRRKLSRIASASGIQTSRAKYSAAMTNAMPLHAKARRDGIGSGIGQEMVQSVRGQYVHGIELTKELA